MEEKRGRQRFNKSVLPPLQQMPLFTQTESAGLAEAQRAVEVGIISSYLLGLKLQMSVDIVECLARFGSVQFGSVW